MCLALVRSWEVNYLCTSRRWQNLQLVPSYNCALFYCFCQTLLWLYNTDILSSCQNMGIPISVQANILVMQWRLVFGLLRTRDKNIILPKFWKVLPIFWHQANCTDCSGIQRESNTAECWKPETMWEDGEAQLSLAIANWHAWPFGQEAKRTARRHS